MKREGYVLVYRDTREMYTMDDAMLCTGTTVSNLKDVVKHFEQQPVKWDTDKDMFGRQLWIGEVDDGSEEGPMYIIYQIKPPKKWRVVV